MAGLVIPWMLSRNCCGGEESVGDGRARMGCDDEQSCGGAWLRPFRVPFLLFRVQTLVEGERESDGDEEDEGRRRELTV
jgi:hypothetical protein